VRAVATAHEIRNEGRSLCDDRANNGIIVLLDALISVLGSSIDVDGVTPAKSQKNNCVFSATKTPCDSLKRVCDSKTESAAAKQNYHNSAVPLPID
jgi:hypothetical protein